MYSKLVVCLKGRLINGARRAQDSASWRGSLNDRRTTNTEARRTDVQTSQTENLSGARGTITERRYRPGSRCRYAVPLLYIAT